LKKCPDHGIDELAQMQHFTDGLNAQTRMLLDASTSGSLQMKDETKAKEIIEKMAHNEYKTLYERSSKKKAGLLELDTQTTLLASSKFMNAQMATLVKHLSTPPTNKAQANQMQGLRCDFCHHAHENRECMPKGSEEANYLANYRNTNSYNQGWGGDQNQQQNPPQQIHASPLEDTLTQFMKMTQSNFEIMRLNQDAFNENHKVSIKNLKVEPSSTQ
jgi:hypothetical protein